MHYRYYAAFIAVVGAVTCAAAETPSATMALLDGSRFVGQTGEKGKGDHHADTITFKNGMFRSLDCENWGFGAASYSVEKKGDVLHFTSTLRSPERGRLEWKGQIVDGKATATFRWRHERWYWNIDREYWFEGEREAARR